MEAPCTSYRIAEVGMLYVLGTNSWGRLDSTEYFQCLLLQHYISLPHSDAKRL